MELFWKLSKIVIDNGFNSIDNAGMIPVPDDGKRTKCRTHDSLVSAGGFTGDHG